MFLFHILSTSQSFTQVTNSGNSGFGFLDITNTVTYCKDYCNAQIYCAGFVYDRPNGICKVRLRLSPQLKYSDTNLDTYTKVGVVNATVALVIPGYIIEEDTDQYNINVGQSSTTTMDILGLINTCKNTKNCFAGVSNTKSYHDNSYMFADLYGTVGTNMLQTNGSFLITQLSISHTFQYTNMTRYPQFNGIFMKSTYSLSMCMMECFYVQECMTVYFIRGNYSCALIGELNTTQLTNSLDPYSITTPTILTKSFQFDQTVFSAMPNYDVKNSVLQISYASNLVSCHDICKIDPECQAAVYSVDAAFCTQYSSVALSSANIVRISSDIMAFIKIVNGMEMRGMFGHNPADTFLKSSNTNDIVANVQTCIKIPFCIEVKSYYDDVGQNNKFLMLNVDDPSNVVNMQRYAFRLRKTNVGIIQRQPGMILHPWQQLTGVPLSTIPTTSTASDTCWNDPICVGIYYSSPSSTSFYSSTVVLGSAGFQNNNYYVAIK